MRGMTRKTLKWVQLPASQPREITQNTESAKAEVVGENPTLSISPLKTGWLMEVVLPLSDVRLIGRVPTRRNSVG